MLIKRKITAKTRSKFLPSSLRRGFHDLYSNIDREKYILNPIELKEFYKSMIRKLEKKREIPLEKLGKPSRDVRKKMLTNYRNFKEEKKRKKYLMKRLNDEEKAEMFVLYVDLTDAITDTFKKLRRVNAFLSKRNIEFNEVFIETAKEELDPNAFDLINKTAKAKINIVMKTIDKEWEIFLDALESEI